MGPALAQQAGTPAPEDHDQPVQGAPLPAGWTARPDGKATAVEVRFVVRGDGTFLVKRREGEKLVYSLDPKTVDPSGIIGLRINHNLDVHVDGFGVHRI